MYAGLRGDICQYLGKTDSTLNGYRLPLRSEFWAETRQDWNTVTPTTDGWLKGDGTFVSSPAAGYADGRADFLATQTGTGYTPNQPTNGAGRKLGSGSNLATGVVLPAGGSRSSTLYAIGSRGYHWSCSALDATFGWELYFTEAYVGNRDSPGIDRSFGVPVRCIHKLPGES
jgi:hypothetical protein